MMSSTERFVVVAGACLLVLNVLLFGLCLALVLDSQANRNENAQFLALTYRLLEKQEATTVPGTTTASSTVPRAAHTTQAEARRPSSEKQVAVGDTTTGAWSEEVDTDGMESGAVMVTAPGVNDTIAGLKETIAVLRNQIDALEERLNRLTASTEASAPTESLERRR